MKYARQCSVTGKGMNKGYVICDGEGYACDEQSLLLQLIPMCSIGESEIVSEYLARCYDLELYYYTEWEDEDDYQYET